MKEGHSYRTEGHYKDNKEYCLTTLEDINISMLCNKIFKTFDLKCSDRIFYHLVFTI